jgi:methyltransferase family protein
MMSKWQRLIKKTFDRLFRRYTHSEMIKQLIEQYRKNFSDRPVFVETGSGLSTVALAEVGVRFGAWVFSCDNDAEKVEELKKTAGAKIENVTFMVGDSIASLNEITTSHDRIDFLFLDSAASAMHTFREFQTVEPFLSSHACVLIDNAALPDARLLLTPCRKGKILVPYLLASTHWQVHAHPRDGDSMISARRFDKPEHADLSYERPGSFEDWRKSFRDIS